MMLTRYLQFLLATVVSVLVVLGGLSGGGLTLAEPVGPVSPQLSGVASAKSQAIEHYNKGVQLFRAAQQENQRGEMAHHRRLLKEARRSFEAALSAKPELVSARVGLGQIALIEQKYPEAIRQFQQALTQEPNQLMALNDLAKAYLFNKQSTQALATYDRLLKLAPAEAQYWYNKGCAHHQLNQLSEAESAYLEAVRLSAGYQQPLFNLATLYEAQGKVSDARTYYQRVKQINAGNLVGLEALHRLEALSSSHNAPATSVVPPLRK